MSLVFRRPTLPNSSLPRSGNSQQQVKRAQTQILTQEDKNKIIDFKILDLSLGRITQLDLPLFSGLQVVDFSENIGYSYDFLWTADLPQLQTIRLNHCELTELPEELPPVVSTLRLFQLESNQLENIPDWLFTLPEINEVSLFGNKLTKISIPATDHLVRIVNLGYNPITEIHVESGSKVQTISLNGSHMSEIPQSLLEAPELRSISLARCRFSGIIDVELPENIACLDLSRNQIEGLSERFVTSCTRISTLCLSYNQIKHLPDCFPSSHFISKIYMNNNLLEDLPASLMSSRNTETFNVSFNNLKELKPFSFPQLRELNVSHNQIGELPDTFGTCNFFSVLNAGFNKLKDLPRSLTGCRKVTDVILPFNEFDHLPRPILSFASIKTLSIAGNCLTTIPESMGAFFMLRALDLSNNNIQEFPKFLNMYTDLRNFSISHNLIKEMPLANLPSKLSSFDISFNQIEKFPSITHLILSNLSVQNNLLTQIPFLKTFPALQFVSVSSNNIEEEFNDDMIDQNATPIVETVNTRISVPAQSRHHIVSNEIISIPTCFGVGYASSMGTRPTMEDSFLISATEKSSFFAIFDGHAGAISSKASSLFFKSSLELIDDVEFDAVDDALVQAYVSANQYILENHIDDGCTAISVYIRDNRCFFVGIGDSRAVLIKKDSYEQITKDQKPSDPDEFYRLRNQGFGMSADCRVSRKLAVSRALGDFWNNANGMFVEPEVIIHDINPEEDVAIVLACDGIWDVMDNEIVSRIVRNSETAQDSAITLKNIALAAQSNDNVTAIVIDLHPKPGDEGLSTRHTVKEIPLYVEKEEDLNQPLFNSPAPRGRRRR